MRYEIYLDTVFLIQFVMNYYVLMMTACVMKLVTSRLRIILASLIGAAGSCFIFLPIGLNGYLKFVLVFVLWTAAIMRIAFRVRGYRQYISMLVALVAITFLLGGTVQWLMASFGNDLTVGIWLVLLTVIYYILQYVLRLYRRQKSNLVPVTVEFGEAENSFKISVVALQDTGNRLREHTTDKGVCILEAGILPPQDQYEYEVSYYALGNSGATLKVKKISQMILHTKEGDIKCKDALLAMYPGKISKSGAYHMILHQEYMKED